MADKPLLHRILGLFADIRPGEALIATLLAVDIFLVLTAYYVIKVVREPLILLGGGAEVKSYAGAGLVVVSIVVVKVYDWLYSRFSRLRLLTVIFTTFAAALVGFWALALAGVPVGVPFFFYVGIFGAFIIAVFWSYANDVYTPEQGKRLFPFVGIGSTAGAALGSITAGALYEPLGAYLLMLLAAGILLLCLGITLAVHRLLGGVYVSDAADAGDADSVGGDDPPVDKRGGLTLVLSERYILYICLLVLVLNWVNTNGEYILDRTLAEAAASAPDPGVFIGEFRGQFYTIVNITVMALQAFVVSRFIKYLGVRTALFVLPLIAIGGYITMALLPGLLVLRIAKTAENSVDYSLQNTAQQALYLGTSREVKYKAKAFIDTFVKRSGDLLSTGVVAAGSALALATEHFVYINIGLALCWLGLVVLLAREHKRRGIVTPT